MSNSHPTPEVRHSELSQLAWDLIAAQMLARQGASVVRVCRHCSMPASVASEQAETLCSVNWPGGHSFAQVSR